MESKESGDGGENNNEFIVISQTLVDICEKVCSKIAFDTTSVHDGGINCENPNVPKVKHGVVKPMATLTSGENGCSGKPLGTAVNGAISCDMECDGTSDTGALKPVVVLNHSENGDTEPLGTVVNGAVRSDIECDGTSGTGALKLAVVLHHSENGATEPLGTAVNGAVRSDIECDSTSDTGALKPAVVLHHSENGATEPLGTSVDGAIKHGMECDDTSDTLQPLVSLTPGENDCSGVPLNTDTMQDGADKSNTECNTTAGTDTVMSDAESKTLLVGENGKDDHHGNNQILCVLDGEAIEEPCRNDSRTTHKDQHESLEQPKTGTDNGDMSGMNSSKDNVEESGEKLNALKQCATSLPVVSDSIVSELSGLEPGPCGTNTQLVEFPTTTENACNKVTQVQNANGLNDCSGQNVIDAPKIRQRRKKKVISKKNRSVHHQTPPSSRSTSHTHGGNVEVNDFEFVLSVVQQDLEEIQMTNATAVTIVSSEDDTHEESSDDEGESSDTSSSSSTNDSPSNESNSKSCKKFAEKLIEEDEDRAHVISGQPRTRDEVLFSELPPPPNLEVMADKDQIKQIGEIESIINVEAMVIIKSFPDVPALDTDTILFLGNGCGFGQVFEIFGQVRSPHYCVRFNSEEEIKEKKLFVGQAVFYAPNAESMTNFVFVSKIQSVKGSDASWKNDQEPPNELLEFSDDEAESAAKASKKKANRLKHRNQTLIQERDAQKNAKKPRTPNAAADCTPPTSKQPWIKQVTRQSHQNPPPPVPFNITPRNPATEFYSERFPLGQNMPMQFNPMSHPPRLGPQPMPRFPSGVFYNHQQLHQYHAQAPPPYPQQPLVPPQFRSLQPRIPLVQHGTYPPIPTQSNPANGRPQHGQPVNLGQFMARPGWPTVHPPTQPPFYCPPR